MTEEWGPWIEHDGTGCPCVGQWVQIEVKYVGIMEVIAGRDCIARGMSPHEPPSAWVHVSIPEYADTFILRYRVRRPKAMETIDGILAEISEREHA